MDKDEVVYTIVAELLAPILNITPQEMISQTDHTTDYTTLTRKEKLPPDFL